MNLDGVFWKLYPFLLMFAGKVKVRDTLALVDATYIFFHSSLKYSSCADFDSPLQK